MEQKQDYRRGFFPRFIDRPRLIGIFEFDEFILVFASIAVVIASSLAFPKLGSLSAILIGTFLGGILGYGYKKFKKNNPNGYAAHYFYRIGAYHPDDKKIKLKKDEEDVKTIPFGFTKEFYN